MACDSSERTPECRRAQDAKRAPSRPFALRSTTALVPDSPRSGIMAMVHRVRRLAGNQRYPGSTFCVQSTIPRNTRRSRRMEFDELSNRVMKCALTAHRESLRVLRGETNRECEQDCGDEGKLSYQIALVEKSAAIAAPSNEPAQIAGAHGNLTRDCGRVDHCSGHALRTTRRGLPQRTRSDIP